MDALTLTNENFEHFLSGGSLITLVDFWAPWCGPCKLMSPVVHELAQTMNEVQVGTLNVDDFPDIAQKYNILSIPTFLIFKQGQVIDQFSGTMPKEVLAARIREYLS